MNQAAQLIVILLNPQVADSSRMVHVRPGDRAVMARAVTPLGEFFGSDSAGFVNRVSPVAPKGSERSGEG
jgi:hypothetical protein